MISHEFWQSRFAGSPSVLGQTVRLDQGVRTIIGVLPPGFQFPIIRAHSPGSGAILKAGQKPFWLPMPTLSGPDLTSRGARMFLGLGRLKEGVSEAAVRAELTALAKRLAADHPESNRNVGFTVVSFRNQVFGRSSAGRGKEFRCSPRPSLPCSWSAV